jgi:SET domain-containing protein
MNSKNSILYLNDTVKCDIKASIIHGVGVFATRDIKKGEDLYVRGCIKDAFALYIFSMDTFKKLNENVQNTIKHGWGLNIIYNDLIFKNPNCTNMARFLNHSFDANSDGKKAVRDIKEGEEVTENYIKVMNVKKIPKELQEHYRFLQ